MNEKLKKLIKEHYGSVGDWSNYWNDQSWRSDGLEIEEIVNELRLATEHIKNIYEVVSGKDD